MWTFIDKGSKIIRSCLAGGIILLFCATVYTAFAYIEWEEYKSSHFIVCYHPSIPNRYVREFTKRCEQYYSLIADRLSFRRFDYWTWDDRGRIFIYQSKAEYIKDRGRPEWSAASVKSQAKAISTYYFEEDFFDTILPHELTHIILREFVGPKARLPVWFKEGVSCANEDGCYFKYLLLAKGFLDKERYLSVPEMEKMDKPGAKFYKMFYANSASLVIFLLEEYGRDAFVQLCREIRDGSAFYPAMEKVYKISSAEALDARFIAFLQNKGYEDIAIHENSGLKW